MMATFRDGNRGQTTQDFAIGIALFFIALLFVLTFIPSVLAPFGEVDHRERAAQAERASLGIISATAVDDERIHLDEEALADFLASESLAADLDLPPGTAVNVTVTPLGESESIEQGGASYEDVEAGVWTRIVTIESSENDGPCTPGCRLVVRVW